MAGPTQKAARTTVYRMTGLGDLADAIRPKYLEGGDFESQELEVGPRPALLVVGSMFTEKATWTSQVDELTGTDVEIGNRTSAAVLLIRDGRDTAWALAYGMGFQLLEQRFIDASFGQRIALRAANPEDLRSLTRSTIDYRARTDRSSIPSGEQLRSFGIGDFGEIVTRLVGSATIEGLSAGAKATIRGADALSIPLGRSPASALADLDLLGRLLSDPPRPELEALEQLKPVKQTPLIDKLEERLRSTLQGEEEGKLGAAWPHERIDESATPTSYKLHGVGRGNTGPFDDVPSIDDLLDVVRRTANVQEAVERIRVQLFRDADGEEPISGSIPVRKWLAFEVDAEGQRYCLHDGRWYVMDQDYAVRLQSHVDEIFSRHPGIELPEWTAAHLDEAAYNVFAANTIGGVALDRKLIHTVQHPRGIEPCDVLTSNGLPIHVKRLDRSTAASHVIAQALVSVDALLHDVEARVALRDKVVAAGGNPDWVADRPARVALGMARRTLLTPRDLFSFTQVTLARLDSALAVAGVEVVVIPIVRNEAAPGR